MMLFLTRHVYTPMVSEPYFHKPYFRITRQTCMSTIANALA